MRSRLWQLRLENRSFSVQVRFSVQIWYTKCILAAPGKAAGQLVGFGVAATELGIGWVSVWVSVWALQIYDSAILDLMCVSMASGGIGFSSSVSVYNGFGLRNKLRDGPLHNEKARGIFVQPMCCHSTRQRGFWGIYLSGDVSLYPASLYLAGLVVWWF